MNDPKLIKTFKNGAAIAPYRAVKFGGDDQTVVQSTAGDDLSFGVSDFTGALASAERVDVILSGISPIEYGAAVDRGRELTSDADGKAVHATENDRVIGIAMETGVDGQIGSVLISISQFSPNA